MSELPVTKQQECRVDYCAAAQDTGIEYAATEDDEFEQFGHLTEAWYMSLLGAKQLTAWSYGRFANHVSEITGGDSSREFTRTATDRMTKQLLVGLRQATIRSFQDLVDEVPILTGVRFDTILTTGNPEQIDAYAAFLREHVDKDHSGIPGKINKCSEAVLEHPDFFDSSLTITNPFHDVFLFEQFARFGLFELTSERPDDVRDLFNLSRLNDLPVDIQQLLLHDLARGKHSIVIDLFTRPHKEGSPTSLVEYVKNNGHSELARKMLSAVAVGTCVNGTVCPENQYGICERVLAQIDPSELSDVRVDMDKHGRGAIAYNRRILAAFAANKSVPQLWNLALTIAPAGAQQQPASRSTRKRTVKSRAEVTLIDSPVEETLRPVEIGKLYCNGNEPVVIDYLSEESIMQAVETVIATKGYQEFIKKYAHEKSLPDFMRSALRTILVGNYLHEEAVKRMVKAKPVVTSAGELLTLFRLSGREQFSGKTGLSSVSKQVRLFFGQRIEDGVRIIDIKPPVYKADIENLSNGGQLLTKFS